MPKIPRLIPKGLDTRFLFKENGKNPDNLYLWMNKIAAIEPSSWEKPRDKSANYT